MTHATTTLPAPAGTLGDHPVPDQRAGSALPPLTPRQSELLAQMQTAPVQGDSLSTFTSDISAVLQHMLAELEAAVPVVPCPSWCGVDHGDPLEEVDYHYGEIARSIPYVVGPLGEVAGYRVEAARNPSGSQVWLNPDVGRDHLLTVEAAEELGRGLLKAAALLRQA